MLTYIISFTNLNENIVIKNILIVYGHFIRICEFSYDYFSLDTVVNG